MTWATWYQSLVPPEGLSGTEPGVCAVSLEWSFFLRTPSWTSSSSDSRTACRNPVALEWDDGHYCKRSSPDLQRSNGEDSCVAKLNRVLLALLFIIHPPGCSENQEQPFSSEGEFKDSCALPSACLEPVSCLQLVDYDPGHWFNGWPRCRRGWRGWQGVWRRTYFALSSFCIRPGT